MIVIKTQNVSGIIEGIISMRNPLNSWNKSDSRGQVIGPDDLKLAKKLCAAGPSHSKFRRMINVYVDIKAPLYWWKEFDTYKVGTVANSCSTMHKISAKEFEWSDFSTEHLFGRGSKAWLAMQDVIDALNEYRADYIRSGGHSKECWWQMIQLLPSSYNQFRSVMINYETLSNIYKTRKGHKLDEWNQFCDWIEALPYTNEIIIGKE